ncbi:ATPase [Salimicrobium jeotgali]|uniref:Cd(2+)-exporting ATPase n=1 Tax=Salimicrobium jeotgali TaxID=1230341 RepID=K2FKN2_9BACI|nr:heavy metal translocating P-type ATPase [Salimicrobium jeotgali]AKG04897.1 ATPase [Salimicrobium jeotgali]EKE31566.1 heavy metal-transporting P-type ATPase [Salimicrobium jeotgali]MBM7696386.1 Cd2+/Zn2+-exporting ATPase [Salimicrobium jeotgali]
MITKEKAKDKEKDVCCSGNQEETAETGCCSGKKEEVSEGTSCCSNEEASSAGTPAPSSEKGETREFYIRGMDCPSCAATVEKSLNKNPGIRAATVSYGTGKLAVGAYEPAVYKTIPDDVKKLGFEAVPARQDHGYETYRIAGMDCGSCAMTIEKHMGRLSSVEDVRVNFSTGNMQVLHGLTQEQILKEVKKSGFEAYPESVPEEETPAWKKGSFVTVISGVFLALGFIGSFTGVPAILVTLMYAISIATGGFKPVKSAYYAVRSKSLDMNVLMASAAIGAAIIGEWFEGAMVVFLFAVGNLLQDRSMEKTRDSIRSLMDLTPAKALVKTENGLEEKNVGDVGVGEVLVVRPGDKIPIDGKVISGTTSINEAPITGESIPSDKDIGDVVYAGTLNGHGALEIRVSTLSEDTAIAKIIHMVEEAQEKKAPTEALIDRFAAVYTPVVFILALLVMVVPPLTGFGTWGEWVYKGLALLVVACPCALVISTPVAIVSAIGNAAKQGVLIKGGTYLEKAAAVKSIAFDKTGTLTEGKPKVAKTVVFSGNEEELISQAATIESQSSHPIAEAILTYAKGKGITLQEGEDFQTMAGQGAKGVIEGREVFVGKPKLFEDMQIDFRNVQDEISRLQEEGNTLVLVGTRESISGVIAVRDTIREVTVRAIERLKKNGMKDMVMLTGDNEGTAVNIAGEAGVTRHFAELMPEDKVTAIQKLQNEGKQVAMVGDGINDAPALATADLGIAMGGAGTDTAMETADIVLMADNLEKLPETISLSKKALNIIKQNIWFSLLTKAAALILIFPGILTLWMAVLSDTGAALIVILNSMRLLRNK